ncbi:MAG: hypothetical protein ACYS99_19910, partial [Planctomycetota bacterium]
MRIHARAGVSVRILALLVVAAAFAATDDPDLIHTFDGGGKNYGYAVGGAGDVNDDGYDDLIVGSNQANDFKGLVHVYSGKDGEVLYSYSGESGTGFGKSVCGVADLNEDGHHDFAIAVRGDATNGANAGAVVVYSGKDGEALGTIYGDAENDQLGLPVRPAGDVNGDGHPDIVIGTYGNYVRVVSGKDWKVIHTLRGESPGGLRFGWSVDGAGDVNDDGCDDVIVGDRDYLTASPYARGSAYVISGKDGSTLYEYYGSKGGVGGWFGYDVAGIGDVNDDGHADFAVSAPVSNSVFVYSGEDGEVLYTLTGGVTGALFGDSVSSAGDVNSDGVPDILVGDYGNDEEGTDCGSASVFSGEDGAELFTLYGGAGAMFGKTVRCAGDVTGDGIDDVIVGAPHAEAAYVYGIPAPTGTVAIDGDAEATSSTSVDLALTWKKADAEITDVRL